MLASEVLRSISLESLTAGSRCLSDYAQILDRFPGTTVEAFLADRPAEDRAQLTALVALEMRGRWLRGEGCGVELYIERFPELAREKDQLLDLIYAEYCARRQRGAPFDSADYYRRFPEHQQSLARLFCVHDLLDQDSDALERAHRGAVRLPEKGEGFLDFMLIRELGRGAFGRVFLASQISLADRLVAVKITSLRTIEPQTLARMQHPNIVPVYSVHRDPLTGLQAVCMPYQGAVALADLRAAWGTRLPTRGEALLDTARALLPPEALGASGTVEGEAFPGGRGYVHACCWMMLRLAEALAHAHSRGICHRDLKPSNVLITADGQPLLVDFNLAFNEADSKGDREAFFGGTLPYMSPEQLEAFLPGAGRGAAAVDARSDLFSLAATFFELMTGRLPFGSADGSGDRAALVRSEHRARQGPPPSAREANPSVPWDLDRLLAKCLGPLPERRYQSAADLAEDLRRILEVYPLRHLGPVRRRDAVIKWLRRNRRPVMLLAVLLTLAAVVSARATHQRSVRRTLEIERDRARAEQEELEREKGAVIRRVDADLEGVRPDQYYWHGFQYLGKRDYHDAIYALTRAVDLGQGDARVYYLRARALASLDRDAEARDDYTRAIEANPNYLHAYLGRAALHASSVTCLDYPQAMRDADQLLERGAEHKDYRIFLYDAGRVYSAASRAEPALLDRAESLLRSAIEHGLTRKEIRHRRADDRYDLLGPLLARPSVQALLIEEEPAVEMVE